MPPRICFVSLASYGYFDPEFEARGGAGRQISLLARELAERLDTHVVVGNFGQPPVQTREGVTLHRSYRPVPDRPTLAKPKEAVTLLRTMRRVDADVYVYRGRPRKAALIYVLTRLLGKPWIYNLASDSNVAEQPAALPWPLQWTFGRSLADATAVIAQTEWQAKELSKRYDVDPVVVPNGYPTPPVEPLPPEERSAFIWVGRLERDRKRPGLFLDLAEAVPQAEFLLIGPAGPDEAFTEDVRDRAASLENVTDVGAVDPDAIHRYYRNAIAFVNTSRTEGFPNTFLESWRYDTPVISLDVDPGRFVDGDIGGFADGDFRSLVGLTKRLAVEPEFRSELGCQAGNYVRSELSIERVAERYGAVVERSLGKNGSGFQV